MDWSFNQKKKVSVRFLFSIPLLSKLSWDTNIYNQWKKCNLRILHFADSVLLIEFLLIIFCSHWDYNQKRSTIELKGRAQYSSTTTEQASYQGAEFLAKREPFGQQTRCEERPISNGVCFNERAVSENYHVLKAEYGQVLFERDQAHRTLQIANLRSRSVLKQRRKNGAYGMDFFPFSINVVFLPYTSILILTTTNVKLTPAQYSPLFTLRMHWKLEDVTKTECLARSIYYALYLGYDRNIRDSFCAGTKTIPDRATGHT